VQLQQMVNVCLTSLVVDSVVQPMSCDLISLLLHEVRACTCSLDGTAYSMSVCSAARKSQICSHCGWLQSGEE